MQWRKKYFRTYQKIRGRLRRRVGKVKTCLMLEQTRNRKMTGGGKMSEKSRGSVWNRKISIMALRGYFYKGRNLTLVTKIKYYVFSQCLLCGVVEFWRLNEAVAKNQNSLKCVQENTKNVSWTVVRITNVGRCRKNESGNRDVHNIIIKTDNFGTFCWFIMRNKIDILYLNASGSILEKEVVVEKEYHGLTIPSTWCG